jgi:ADP-heptose:LPS heptosyltransferase
MKYKSIVISRTDSIGDVVLTLPLAGWLKQHYPDVRITFLGAAYTRPVAEACVHVDDFIEWAPDGSWRLTVGQEIISRADLIIHVFPRKEIAVFAKEIGIPDRLGTTNRFYHWSTCNKLAAFSRKRSDLHESQLNFKLLSRVTGSPVPCLSEISGLYGLEKLVPLKAELSGLTDKKRFNLILHPKSKGSAREWGQENFSKLIGLLPRSTFRIFITGTEQEGKLLREAGFFNGSSPVTDLTGRLTLAELISFIAATDGLVAASTGPLHLAAALGKHALGLYPPIRPMHPGRWAPAGKNASFISLEKNCSKCRKTNDCECMRLITPEQVAEKLYQNL